MSAGYYYIWNVCVDGKHITAQVPCIGLGDEDTVHLQLTRDIQFMHRVYPGQDVVLSLHRVRSTDTEGNSVTFMVSSGWLRDYLDGGEQQEDNVHEVSLVKKIEFTLPDSKESIDNFSQGDVSFSSPESAGDYTYWTIRGSDWSLRLMHHREEVSNTVSEKNKDSALMEASSYYVTLPAVDLRELYSPGFPTMLSH